MAKKQAVKHELNGILVFQKVDNIAARFDMKGSKIKHGSQKFEIPADLFPVDFDPNIHEVTGNFVVNIEIAKRKG